jgi:beta-lactamase regulating signal transducer with metallopeptidase domain
MIVWMLYSVTVATLVAAGARAAEWLARMAGYRVRWVWTGGLVLTVGLSVTTMLRDDAMVAGRGDLAALSLSAPTPAGAAWSRSVGDAIAALRNTVGAPLRSAAGLVYGSMPSAANMVAGAVALVLSAGLLLVLVGVGVRFRRARGTWPRSMVHGVEVRVAPRIGPVVIGLLRPEIVVPRWLLTRTSDEQHLVVAHESEHVRARDPLLLAIGWGAVVFLPWNPALWYMFSRLRLAIELDCDARVLRRGARPQSYGSLLIDVAQQATALRPGALALADDASHLQQRILAMKPQVLRFARLRGALAALFASVSLMVACQETLPPPPETSAKESASPAGSLIERAETPGPFVVARDSASPVVEGVAKVPVAGRMRLLRKVPSPGAERREDPVSGSLPRKLEAEAAAMQEMRHDSAGRDVSATLAKEPGPATAVVRPDFPMILIDGVRAAERDMQALDPGDISRVEVIKGGAAMQRYADPAAANGVILITTKRAKP